ncbi:hypothetical protein E2I00_004240, partial [Balaenoptera physalus]
AVAQPMILMASDTPESLMALCTDFCLRNLDGTLGYLLDKETLRLHPDIFLPSEICDRLVNEYVELVNAACNFEPHESFFSLFSDPRSTRLTRIHLREDLVQDQDLEAIRKQDLVELYLTNCEKLSAKSLQTLRSFSHTLVSLSLRLRFLNLGRMIDGVPVESLLRPLNSLAALDLSGIQTSDAAFLTQWKDSLVSLVLYNMDLSDDHIRVIVQLHKLRHLDISRDRLSSYYKFKLTRKVLSLFVQKLGNLMSLDISGHMILENCSISKMDEDAGQTSIEPSKSSIMPFRALKRPLQFLGLFETSLCRLTHIPAYKVSGDKNEEQVLNAIEAYTEHRPEITSRAINLLFDIARIERCNQLLRALKYRSEQSIKLRRQVIQVVLNGMESYQEVTVQRNCCLTLCNFSIPEELEFQYRRVNELLLSILNPTRQDESIQRIAVHLCNALVCQTMLKLIQKKLLDKISKADGIEVSYNACGVLSHIMFDGPEAWGICEPQREEVEERMWAAIQSWDINSRRNINYRSFEPILRLLPQGISPVSQHWATWALYNLVSVYPDKYCPLLIKEGGMPLLRDMIKMATARQETKEMARKVIEHCSNFKEENMDTSR